MLRTRQLRFYLLAVFLLIMNGLIGKLSSNQENYFALAKAAWNPSWMKGSFLFTEHAGTRVLFNLIVGPLSERVSFELISISLTIFAFCLMAYPLLRIWQRLHDEMGFTTIWLQVVVLGSLGSGAFYGGEWFIGNFEPKVMAYICFWWALWALLNGKRAWMVVLCVVATYWHVLVGGQTFALLWTLDLWRERKWKNSLLTGVAYSVCVIPFLWHLLRETAVHDQGEPAVDWIYTYFRNPHHTAPFVSIEFFKRKFLKGVLLSGAATLYLAWVSRAQRDNKTVKFLAEAGLLANIFVFGGLLLSFLDKTGGLLKFYVFRLSAIAKFLTLMPLGFQLHQFIKSRVGYARHYATVMAVLLVICLGIGVQRFAKRWPRPDLTAMSQAVKQYVPEGGQLLNLSENGTSVDGQWDALPRLSERDWYVSYKFVPAGGDKVREWYNRIQRVKGLSLTPEQISPAEFPYILAPANTPLGAYQAVFTSNGTTLFVAR